MARPASFRKSRILLSRMLSATALTAAGMMALQGSAEAADNAWTQFEDVHGSISIDAQTPGQTKIDQHTQTYIGNSNNLDILQGQTVTIGQNNTGALFVGRSTRKGSDPTRILGSLNTRLKDANGNFTDAVGGTVMVLDRNGVVFGHNARIDVGGIIASTGDISNQDILNADGQYEFSDFGPGSIDIQGSITVSDAGLAAFVSPTISNSGVINARMGKVVMASGEKVTLDLYGDELVEVAVSDELSHALIENTGTINAQGGTVVVKAEAAKDIVDNVINMGGVVNASSAEVKGGKIVLGGGKNGTVKVTGKLDASGAQAGSIKVTGKDIAVEAPAELKAASTATAADGGQIDVIASNDLFYNGRANVAGGAGANGGFIETSGLNTISFGADAAVEGGAGAHWLIDPNDITIDIILGTLLNGWLATLGDATITTAMPFGPAGVGNITVDSLIIWNTAAKLNLIADNDIILNASILSLHNAGTGTAGSVGLHATNDIDVKAGANVLAVNGNIDMQATNGDIKIGGTGTGDTGVTSENGIVTLIAGKNLSIGGQAGKTTVGSYNNDANFGAYGDIDIKAGTGANAATLVGSGAGTFSLYGVNNVTVSGNGTNTATIVAGVDAGINAVNGALTLNDGSVVSTTRNTYLNGKSIALNGGSITASGVGLESGTTITQQADATMTAGMLAGSSMGDTSLIGAGNVIGVLGDFTTGTGNFKLNDTAASLNIIGGIVSNGGQIDIANTGAVNLADTGSLTSFNNNILLGGSDLTLDGNITTSLNMILKAASGAINQTGGTLIAGNNLNVLAGTSASLTSATNQINKLKTVTTNGNFALNDSSDGMRVVGNVNTNGGNVDIDVVGNLEIVDDPAGGGGTGRIDAKGGNIDINQTGTFSSAANTLKTSGTGTINIEQRAGGSISQAVQAFDNSGSGINTALVHNGTYNENVLISDSNVHVVSAGGRANTTIIGDESYGGAGTIEVASGANNIKIGDYNKGFKIVGFDSVSPGLEKAAVYLTGTHENVRVIHNEIEANGEAGLLTEYAAALNNIIIDSNLFSGKTFSGANPGIGNQFTVANVPRALLFIGGDNGGQNKTNITVSNNQFTGTVGGTTTGGVESSNTAVTVDAHTARITGNTFNPVVKGTATSLRTRGKNTLISGNTFDNANLGATAGHLLVSHGVYDGALVDGVQDDINDIYANNTFIGNVTTTDNTGTSGTTDYIGYTIQSAVNAASNGARIRVSDGTFNEAVNVNKSVSITGTGTTNTTIVDGTGLGANADGFTINANDISLNGMIVRNFGRAGINVQSGNRTNLSLDDIDASGNKFGLRTSTSAGLDGFTVTNSHFDNNEQGWVVQKGNDSSVFNNVTVTNTTFNNNSDKGIYAEKLSNAEFTDITVNNSGTRANYGANAGIDINLKYGDYENIAFNNVTVTGSGANGTGSGVALTVKARDDGSYATNPASLTGLSINGGTVSGAGDTAIALGNNITDATVDGVTVSGNNGIVAYGGVDKLMLSDNIMTLTGASIGVSDADDVTIVRNDITGGTTGIGLVNVTNATVGGSTADGNTIRNIAGGWNNAGISIRNGGDLTVSHNILSNVGGQSIRVDGSWGMPETLLTIADNRITDAQFNAITLAHWNGATISGNEIDGVAVNHGIHLDLARNTDVIGNDIRNVTGDGIHLRRGNIATKIQGNTIDNAANGIVLARIGSEINQQTLVGDTFGGPLGNTITNVGTGILSDGSENTWIDSNTINKASVAGVDVKDGTGYSIINFNKIDGSGHGIRMVNSTSGVIASNKIGLNGNMTGHGITVQDSDDTDILSNELKNVAQRGINIVRGNNIDVNDNTLEKIGQNGIRTDQVKGINLNRNKLESIGWSGIELQGGTNAVVNRNTVKKAGGNGIQISGTNGVDITTNTVNDVRENGIIATGAAKAVISANTVDKTGKDGVAVVNSVNAKILNNKIGLNGGANNIGTGAVGGDGVFVSGGNGAVIKGNDIANTRYNQTPAKGSGILVVKSGNVVIGGTAAGEANHVNNAGSDGIVIRADGGVADNNSIIGNLIENVQRTGVYLHNASNTTVHRNIINNAGITLPDNGVITAIGGSNATITRNDIHGGAGHGIQLKGMGGTNIVRNNDVDGVGKDGITAQGVSGLRIVNNDIGQNGTIGGNGVSVDGSSGARVNDNTINNTGNNGILLTGGTDITIRDNVIGLSAPSGNIGGNGIETSGVGDVRITGNEIRRTLRDAILANGTGTARINRNIIRNVGEDGIEVSGFTDARIDRNRITNAGEDGIEVSGNAAATLRNNRITGSTVRGIYASGDTNGDVVLAGNRLIDNKTGAEFQSGKIDLTGATNTISGGDIGLRFDPKSVANASNLMLAGITPAYLGGSIGSTVFEGLTDPADQFIVLDNGAFFDPGQPSLIDARYARFNGVSASDDPTGRFRLYQPQLDAIESRVFHFKDLSTLGQIFYGNLNSVPVIIDITSVDQEDTLQYFSPVTFQSAGLSITINGLPSISGGIAPQALNSITPFAGGTDPSALNDITPAAGGDTSPAALNAIDTASGSTEASCWADASGMAQGGQVVNISYGATAEDALSSAATCGAGI